MQSLNIERHAQHAVIQMDHGKVNAIDIPLARDLRDAFLELEADEAVKGLILCGRPHCFSAGLNILSLAQGGIDGAREFWQYYHQAIQAMVRYSRPFVCAITGYAPAGGTILTLAADYRIMGKGAKHVMGMNEFKMSMQIPELLSDIFAYQLGEREAWKAVQEARLFNSDEALTAGLVDESVEVEKVMERAEKKLKKLMAVHTPVYQKNKKYLRKDLLELVDRDFEPMIEEVLENLKDPFVQQSIQMFLMSLKK